MKMNKAVSKIFLLGLLVGWVVPVHGQDNTEAQCGSYSFIPQIPFNIDAVGISCDAESNNAEKEAKADARINVINETYNSETLSELSQIKAKSNFNPPCPATCPASYISGGLTSCDDKSINYGTPSKTRDDFIRMCALKRSPTGETYEERIENCAKIVNKGPICVSVFATIPCKTNVGRWCQEEQNNNNTGKFTTDTNR